MSIDDDIKKGYLINECRHCGNNTHLDIVASHDVCDWEETTWLILSCGVCGEISFARNYAVDEIPPSCYLFDIVYPVKTYQNVNVPDEVHNAFESALKARHLDHSICLMALRRTLEIICKEQGETEGSLDKKIKRLSEKGVFPPLLKEASELLRQFGNIGAHESNEELCNDNILKEIIDFTKAIIEYVYILPYRIKKMDDRLLKIKNGNVNCKDPETSSG